MNQKSYIVYVALVVLSIILSQFYGRPAAMNVFEFFEWVKKGN